jgi:hypothetical protein
MTPLASQIFSNQGRWPLIRHRTFQSTLIRFNTNTSISKTATDVIDGSRRRSHAQIRPLMNQNSCHSKDAADWLHFNGNADPLNPKTRTSEQGNPTIGVHRIAGVGKFVAKEENQRPRSKVHIAFCARYRVLQPSIRESFRKPHYYHLF